MPDGRATTYSCTVLLLALLLCCGAARAAEYVLAAGDEIRIQVYQEPDLTMTVRLDRTGLINYPYIGSLMATGKTPAELRAEIDRGLRGDVLIDPSVNVSISRYRNFYLGGEIRSPGGYPYEPGLTVRQALNLGGGITEYGSESRIEILREGASDPVPAELDSPVRPGDTITVRGGLF